MRKTMKRKAMKIAAAGLGAALVLVFLSACPIDSEYLDTIQAQIDDEIQTPNTTNPPGAPSELEATALSTSQIDLTWTDNSENEEEFQIQRKKAGTEDWQTENVGSDSTAYTDKGLDADTKYIYRVRAVNSNGESEWTAEDSATTLAPPIYTVTYDGNGADSGTVPVDDNEYLEGNTVTVLGNTGNLVKNTYSFVGWNTEADRSGTDYVKDSTFEMAAQNVTLYAQWSQNAHTITFDPHGGSGLMPDQNIDEGDTAKLIPNSFTRTGYTFKEWTTEENGGGNSYTDEANYTMENSDVTLYAQWTKISYQLTVTAGDGGTISDPASSPLTVDYGEETTITANPNSGYEFVSWSITSGSASIQSTGSASTTVVLTSEDATVQASFVKVYTVTYDGMGNDGGTVPTDSNTYESGDTVTVKSGSNLYQTDTTNRYFVYWNTESDGSGTFYVPGGAPHYNESFVMGGASVTLYAIYIGDRGPSSGWLFYDKGSFDNNWRYIEAAESDQSTGYIWSNLDGPQMAGATAIDFGSGVSNTNSIVGQEDHTDSAAQVCLDHETTVYPNWFLPSKNELHEMYEMLKRNNIGGFAESTYWSSSEIHGYSAFSLWFVGGLFSDSSDYNKGDVYRVRAIRYF